MKNLIGVMQGRLLPKYMGRYQAHPVGYWQDEFIIAKKVGLDCIEFILDYNDIDENPLIKEGGIDRIKEFVIKTGTKVKTICADYFMYAPLHSEKLKIANNSQKILINLINSAAKLDITDIVIPCVDQSSLDGQRAANRFFENLSPIVAIAEDHQINLSLETDLCPKPFLKLLNRFNSSHVTVNYDIGNSAALGYNIIEELDTYGDRISDIHIKDRLFGGDPILLGKGNADFTIFFNKLKEFDYKGPFIMQAYRDEEGLEIFKKQLQWITPYLND